MSEGCKVCGFSGGDAEHVEHAHKLAQAIAKRLKEAQEKSGRLEKLFALQNKNRLILGLGNENGKLRGELARLKDENGRLQFENDNIRAANEQFTEEFRRLKEEPES